LIYIYTYIWLSLISVIDTLKPKFKFHYILVTFGLFLMVALRYDVGTDYFAYYDFFGRERDNIFDVNFEPGFSIVVYFLRLLGISPEYIMAVFGLVSIIMVYIGISNHSRAVGLSLLIYFCLYMIPMNFNAIGQGIAIGFYLCSLKYILNREMLKTCLISAAAFLMHSSGIFIIISFFFLNIKATKVRLISFIALSCFLVILNSQISSLIVQLPIVSIADKMASYSNIFEGSVSYASYLIRLFVISLLVFVYDRMSLEEKKIMQLYVLSIFFYSIFFNNSLLATRINLFFKVLDVILLANLVFYFKSGSSRTLMLLFIISFCFFILSVNFSNEKIWNYQVIQKL